MPLSCPLNFPAIAEKKARMRIANWTILGASPQEVADVTRLRGGGYHASELACTSSFRQYEPDDVFTGALFIRLGAPCDAIALRLPMA